MGWWCPRGVHHGEALAAIRGLNWRIGQKYELRGVDIRAIKWLSQRLNRHNLAQMLGIPVGHFGEWCRKNGCSSSVDNDATESDFAYFVEVSRPDPPAPSPPQQSSPVLATGCPVWREAQFQRETCEMRAQLALREERIAGLEAEVGRLRDSLDAPYALQVWESFFRVWIARAREERGHQLVPTQEDFRHHRFPSDPLSRTMYALLSLMRKGDKETLTHVFGTPSADTLQEHLADVLGRLHIDPREMLMGRRVSNPRDPGESGGPGGAAESRASQASFCHWVIRGNE
jgi:hypothetical protein